MFKFELYKKLLNEKAEIFAEAKKAADEIGIPADLRGKFGLTGAISGCPAPMRADVEHAMAEGGKKVIPLASLVEEIRGLVKSVYGDEYDVASTPVCEAGLWVTFDALVTPPMQGRGDNYRSRYIALYEKHLHHQGGYGRPFPGKYKDILADRGTTAGELGFYGKRQNNTDMILARLAGANYECHGIKYHPCTQLADVDPEESMKSIYKLAERHASMLNGVTSLGYDTPGYGYGAKDEEGTPLLQKYLGQFAKDFDIPYIIDNAWGLPFIGSDPRKTGADVTIYSMDKATGAATSGLIIGKEEVMVPIRRALGMHGDRWGTTNSYGKAAYVIFDPGKEALLTQAHVLRTLRDNPESYTKPTDDTYNIIVDEFKNLHPELMKGITITKSYNSGAVEINYEKTWSEGKVGIPVFSIEDMYNGSHLLQLGLAQMGIIPTIGYDANIFVSPGLATTDENGQVIEERMRLAVRGLVKLLEILARHAGAIN